MLVAHVLKSQGVQFIFTLCGGHISPILVGCKAAGIRVVDTRHEATAVFAADGVRVCFSFLFCLIFRFVLGFRMLLGVAIDWCSRCGCGDSRSRCYERSDRNEERTDGAVAAHSDRRDTVVLCCCVCLHRLNREW